MIRQLLYPALSIICLFYLSACVNSGTGDTTSLNQTEPTPSLPSLQVSATAVDIKTLRFSWNAYSGATSYKLFVNPDGVSGYTQVGGVIAATSYDADVPVHRIDWNNATYKLEAYNADVLVASSSDIAVNGMMLDLIGYVKASNPDTTDYFGGVSISGDGTTLVVSSRYEDSAARGIDGDQTDNTAADSGAVYVYRQGALGWFQEAYIKARNADAGDLFGPASLSDNGNTLVVCAVSEDSSATTINGNEALNDAVSAGAAYVFQRQNGTWTQQAYLKPSNGEANDKFCSSVAISGDGMTIAVGATWEASNSVTINSGQTNNGLPQAGAAYIFSYDGTNWSQQAYIKPAVIDTGDFFGFDVALSDDGNTLAVSAPLEDSAATGVDGNAGDNSIGNSGAAYIFNRSGATWSQTAYIKSQYPVSGDSFARLALSGDGQTLAVGAYKDGSGGVLPQSGAVYVYQKLATGWSYQAYLEASNREASDRFGSSMAISDDGNILVIGAPGEDSIDVGVNAFEHDNSGESAGAAYLFVRNGNSWTQQTYIKAPNTQAGDSFAGVSVSDSGNTLVVGAVGEDGGTAGLGGNLTDNSLQDSGAVYIY